MGHFGFNFGFFAAKAGTVFTYLNLKEGIKHGFKETKHPDSLG
jgi:hypothetical protein